MAKRIRRTAEASQELILSVAAERLQEFGLAGLNVVDVARQAGMSHGTLLHHFGSSDGMRRALVQRMSETLLDEVVTLMEHPDNSRAGMANFFERLFTTLSTGGHAKLMAWLASTTADNAATNTNPAEPLQTAGAAQFHTLLAALTARLAARGDQTADAQRNARYVVLLVLSSAIGLGVNRNTFTEDLGLGPGEEQHFARWLSAVIERNLA